jgi:hypothetical protein
MALNTTRFPLRGTQPRSATRRAPSPPRPSDDEILGLVTAVARPAPAASGDADEFAPAPSVGSGFSPDQSAPSSAPQSSGAQPAATNPSAPPALSPALAQTLDANPQLRDAWDAAQQFRAVFATPAAAQDAKNQLGDLDAMFFSSQPADQAALAARIHELSPSAFQGLAQAMQAHAARLAAQTPPSATPSAQPVAPSAQSVTASPSLASSAASTAPPAAPASAQTDPSLVGSGFSPEAEASPLQQPSTGANSPSVAAGASPSSGPTSTPSLASSAADPRRAAQLAFFHTTNSAAVHQVIAAIETQVNHLLPSGVSAPTKTRIVGEIYRDLSSALGANRQLGHQLREAFRSGAGDAAHQQAIVSLVAGRARQALPSIARRVINEWTHSVVSANNEKLSRHDAAAKRVDISGGGSSDGVRRKPLSPRDVDYKRLSDADILNL